MNDVLPPSEPAPIEEENDGSGLLAIAGAIFHAILNWFIIPIGIVLILHNFVFQAFHVFGHSMDPTLAERDYLIVSKVDASISRFQSKPYIPKRGEIVVFKFPRADNSIFVKRVIGTPGDRVVVKGGKITVFNDQHPDGFNPDLKYLPPETFTEGDVDTVVQPGTVFFVGDNRTPNGSYDSRAWGALESQYIIGKAVLRLLPLDKFRIITTPKVGLEPSVYAWRLMVS
jgi:signal peptidase I